MTQLQTLGFGSGIIWAFPNGGQNGSNITPVEIGTLQNMKLDFTADIKSLYGLNSYPVDTAIGKRAIKGTAAFAQLEFTAWNSLIFGSAGSATVGASEITSYREAALIPATPGPYTVSVSKAAHFVQDGGVRYASTGQPLIVLTSGTPAEGQYTVSSGVYTFAAADQGVAVVITYSYSSATEGQTFTVVNQAMGTGPIVGVQCLFPYEAPSYGDMNRTIYLPNVRFGNLSLTTKLDDYTEENTSFEAFASPSGQVIQACLPW